jgi:hypothetical protein
VAAHGHRAGDRTFRTPQIQAMVARLRKRVPAAFREVDDVRPGGGKYLSALAVAVRAQLNGEALPPEHLREWCEDSEYFIHGGDVDGEAELPHCGHRVWTLGVVGAVGRDAVLGYVPVRCGELAEWVSTVGFRARCTRHAARMAMSYRRADAANS